MITYDNQQPLVHEPKVRGFEVLMPVYALTIASLSFSIHNIRRRCLLDVVASWLAPGGTVLATISPYFPRS